MAIFGRGLSSIRAPFFWKKNYFSSLSSPRVSLIRLYEPFKIGPTSRLCAIRLRSFLNSQRGVIQKLHFAGRNLNHGSFIGVSAVVGAVKYCSDVAHSMNEGPNFDPWNSSWEDDDASFRTYVRKLWLPIVLLVTVLMGWNHPVSLAIKVALFLFSTKPDPFSVYLFIEQMRRKSMHDDPSLFKLKPFYASKVDVQDYNLLCVAKVELRDRKLTLIGITGSWWVLHSSVI